MTDENDEVTTGEEPEEEDFDGGDFEEDPDAEDLEEDLAEDLDDDDEEFDDDDDDDDEEEEEPEEEEAPRTKRRKRDEDEDDDDEDLVDDDDVEADLDRILKDRMVAADDDDDEEEEEVDDRGEGGERLQPKQTNEQLCQSCFLLVKSTAPNCPVGDDDCPIFT